MNKVYIYLVFCLLSDATSSELVLVRDCNWKVLDLAVWMQR